MFAGKVAVTWTTPLEVIEIPDCDGVIVYVSLPVPPETPKAVDESARPNVVVIFEPPDITRGAFTVITNEMVFVEVTESETVIVSAYVPCANPVVVIAPVLVLIDKPVCGGEIAKVLVPVPFVTDNALDVYGRPWVVVNEVMPETVIVSLTTIVKLVVDETFKESVAVTDSLYVPLGKVAAAVTIPVFVSIVRPVWVGLME